MEKKLEAHAFLHAFSRHGIENFTTAPLILQILAKFENFLNCHY